MDSVHNKAVIALSFADQVGGYQYLNLDTSSFDPAFRSQAPPFPDAGTNISENILVDPDRNLILSPNELLNYELVNVTTTTTPTFFEQNISALDPFYFSLDSAGEDCSTGIALASVEDESSGQSQVYIADLGQAVFTPGTPGTPGTWTYPSPPAGAQVQPLSESFLANGATGIAVAQGTHTGVIAGENSLFALSESAITAIALPTTSGSGIPAITDWVTCEIGEIVVGVNFRHGRDPHTVTAYKSPSINPSISGHAIALLANRDATTLAVVDLTNMLDTTIVPRTSGFNGGHACTTSLPASVVTFIPVP